MSTDKAFFTASESDAKFSINQEQRLYVIRQDDANGRCIGYSCLGFDYVERRIDRLIADGLSLDGPPAPVGTSERFAQHHDLIEQARARYLVTGTRSNADLIPQLIGLEGKCVEVTHRYTPDGEVETTRFTVGKSTGWIPCHLQLHNRRSMSGAPVALGEILSVCVIKK